MVLYDFPADDNFPLTKALNLNKNSEWHSVGIEGDNTSPFKVHIRFFIVPLKLLFHIKKIKCVVTWQQFYGLVLSCYCRLFHIKKIKITVLTFIYKEKKGVVGKLFNSLIKFAIESNSVDRLICFSKNESDYYKKIFPKAANKFCSTSFGVKDETDFALTAFPSRPPNDGGYIVSVGRSNRDYAFLINALHGTTYKLKIVCDSLNKDSEENIEVLKDISYGEELYRVILNSYCVVIALNDIHISAGQFVFIQAMMLGKPIIVTKTDTLENYVIDGGNGFIIEKSAEELISAIEKLLDLDTYNRMSHNARYNYEQYFTIEAMCKNIAKIIENKTEQIGI